MHTTKNFASSGRKETGKTPRREFLKRGTMAAICASLPLGIIESSARAASSNFFSIQTFAPYLNEVFQIHPGESAAVRAILVRVEDQSIPAIAQHCPGECFSLGFSVPAHQKFSAGINIIRHPALGEFSLFISPVNSPALRRKPVLIYEAVIDRRLPKPSAQITA
jgi:hypothetical protein